MHLIFIKYNAIIDLPIYNQPNDFVQYAEQILEA